MPRGRRKSLTPEERLVEIESKIAEYTEEINFLQEEKKTLEKEIRDKQLGSLYELIQASGKSIDDVRLMLA